MRKSYWIAMILLSLCAVTRAQNCETEHHDFDLSSPYTNQSVIKASIQNDLKYNDLKPFMAGGLNHCATIETNHWARNYNRYWLEGTGVGGDNLPLPAGDFKEFFIANPNRDQQTTMWSQEIEIDPDKYYNFHFYACNLWDLAASADDNSPEIAIYAHDGRGLRQLTFDYYTYDVSIPGQSTVPSNTGGQISSLVLDPMGTGTGTFPEYFTTHPNVSTGLPWVYVETGPIKFREFYRSLDDQTTTTVRLFIDQFDAFPWGSDLGLDKVCLEELQPCGVTVNSICEDEALSFEYQGPKTVDKWYIDGTDLGTGQQNDPPDHPAGPQLGSGTHNLKRGTYLLTAEFTDGTFCHAEIRVKGPWPNTSPILSYTWNTNTQIKLDDTHDGESISFKRYTTYDYNLNDGTGTGEEDINPTNGEYLATVDATSTKLEFCKIVDYGCATPQRACEKICTKPFYNMSISVTSNVYNSSTGEYDVQFDLVNPPTSSQFYWTYGDDTEANTSSTSVSKTYSREGKYTVMVAARRGDCVYDAATLTLTLCPPANDDVLIDVAECLGYSNTFDADPNANDHPATTYQWMMNGELLGTAKTQAIGPLDKSGLYNLSVTKRNNCSTAEPKATITIHDIPNAGFTYGMDPLNGLNVKLHARSEAATTYEWYDITVGTPGPQLGVGQDINHTFPGGGTYTIQLKVIENGCEHTSSKTICVEQDPKDCCGNCAQ